MEFKVKRRPLEATAVLYEPGKGLEDGFATVADVVTNAHVFSASTVQIETEKGIMCPYINCKRGRVFINSGDWIILENDGGKHVVSENNLWNRFEKL